MTRASLVVSGPIERRNASILLALAVCMVVIRVPLSFLLLLILPAVVILIQGVRRGRGLWTRPLGWLFGVGIVSPLISLLVAHSDLIGSTGNAFFAMLAPALIAVATFSGGRPLESADRIMDGLTAGLYALWMISIGEVLTGLKLLAILYPSANTLAAVMGDRFFVTAGLPNYNDYSVAMVMLDVIVVAKMIFARHPHPLVRLLRWFTLLSSAGLVGYMGSRGAAVAMLVGVAVVVIMSIRVVRARVLGPRGIVISALIVLVLGGAYALSPEVQDHSTALRGQIIAGVMHLLGTHPLETLVGWGAGSAYSADAAAAYPNRLMDPHNVLLEIVIFFGVPVLALYLVAWWRVVRHGLVRLDAALDWRSVAAFTLVGLNLVLGIVPSWTLRYHLVFPVLIAAFAYLARRRTVRGAPEDGGGPALGSARER